MVFFWGLYGLLNQLVAVGTIYHPYRLNTNYLNQNQSVAIGIPSSTIQVDAQTKQFIEKTKKVLYRHDFKQGNDLIGFFHLNGLVFSVGGRSPGAAWYLSGIAGAKQANSLGLKQIPQERLLKAWFVISENDRESLPDFSEFGINFLKTHNKIFEITHPVTKEEIVFYKPSRNQ